MKHIHLLNLNKSQRPNFIRKIISSLKMSSLKEIGCLMNNRITKYLIGA